MRKNVSAEGLRRAIRKGRKQNLTVMVAGPEKDPLPWWDHRVWGTALRLGEAIAMAVGLVALVLAVIGLNVANEQTKLTQQALYDQQLASAWQILSQTGAGTTGKKYAIEMLMALEQPISGLDLSCEAVQGITAEELCTRRPNLTNMRIAGLSGAPRTIEHSNFTRTYVSNTHFEGVDFTNVRFDMVDAYQASFVMSTLHQVSFRNARLSAATFNKTRIWSVDFTNADLVGARFIAPDPHRFWRGYRSINISGAEFCLLIPSATPEDLRYSCANGLDQEFFDAAWFYADNPPKIPQGSIYDNLQIRAGCERDALGGGAVDTMVDYFRPAGCDDITTVGQIASTMGVAPEPPVASGY
jgi:uncharacterized protein YjbI with pentapeptide repeats